MFFESIREDISSKYKKQKDVKIAEKCLQLGEEWTRIVSDDFSSFTRFRVPAGADPKEYKKQVSEECKQYIKSNLDAGDPKTFAPWLFSFILQAFLSAIINWVVRRIIERLFENDDKEDD